MLNKRIQLCYWGKNTNNMISVVAEPHHINAAPAAPAPAFTLFESKLAN
jgi:hypothetical protein